MKFLIQRVTEARVMIEEQERGAIKAGLLVLVGICDNDDQIIADKMIKKLIQLRIFADREGKSNLNLISINGGLLLISQFTLYANCRKGNRPSFINAGEPEHAHKLYNYMVKECTKLLPDVQSGEFGADMKVTLTNDGPYTIILDSQDIT